MVKLFYHDKFDLERESISLRKHKLVKDRLLNEEIVNKENIIEAKPLTIDDLLLVHTKEYVDAVKTGKPRELAESNGIRWGEDVYERSLYSLGSVYQALEDALKNSISGALSSGYHHAHRSHGKGFCTFNYVIPLKKLMNERKINNALILDCDVHHPDGTEDCIGDDERITSLSINGTSAFKNKKNKVSFGISLPEGIDYYKYESRLEYLLSDAINKKKPDIILYKASQDSHKNDPFGNLKFTTENLFERDQFVFRYAKEKRIPIAFTIGSGYSRPIDTTVNGHINTVKAAIEVENENYINYGENYEELESVIQRFSRDIEEERIYFIEKLIDRSDRMNKREMRAGKAFGLDMTSFYYKIDGKWDYNGNSRDDDSIQSISLPVLFRKFMKEDEFREICKKCNIPKDLGEKIVNLKAENHFVLTENKVEN